MRPVMTTRPLAMQPGALSALLGESEMGRRVRAFDWSSTPLGPIERWPQSLLIAVGICLNSRFPMFVWWGKSLINIYNDGYIPMLGARHPAGLGRPARDSWEDIWADVGPQADLVMNEGKATWNERVHLRMQRHGFWEDTWFTWSYSPIPDDDGGIGGLFQVCADETARVLAETERDRLADDRAGSEQRLRAMVSASSDVVYRMSPDWTHMRQLQGREFIEDTTVESAGWIDRYIPPEDQLRVRAALDRAIARREPFELEHRVLRADGSPAWTFSRAVPILDEKGEILEWFGAASDVTARKEAEETLRASEAALKDADRRKDEFLAMLAHELRNPLAPISNALQTLRMHPDADTARRAREMMDRQLKQMVRLVDDLLDVSRITRGKVALQKEPARLSEIVEAAVETVKPLIDVRRQQLSVDLGSDAWLDADKARLSQVFGNMLNNASKFTPGGGRIALIARNTPDGVTIEVRDNGMGIPREQLKSIFDMFEQVDHSIERAHSGLGIGLTIVKSMVEMHGGTVEAASDGAGKGATFRVRLPTRAAPRAAPPVEDKAAAIARARLKLLVVDDNRDSAQSLGMMLELLGHEVQLEYDGPGALRTVDHFAPHAVFLDIGLPGMDGFDVCRRLRAGGRADDVVVIAQTGWGDPAQRARSHEAGFDHHLVKPVDVATLKSLLSDIAGRAR